MVGMLSIQAFAFREGLGGILVVQLGYHAFLLAQAGRRYAADGAGGS